MRKPRAVDEHADARLVERVFELAQPVGRVDVDENRANLRGRVLRDHPLGSVRAPDADAVAAFDAEREQRARRAVHFAQQLAVGVAEFLMAGDERVAIPEPRRGTVERRADRLAEKRHRTGTVDIRQHRHRDWRMIRPSAVTR